MRNGLSFDDVLLVPKQGVLYSRKEADLLTPLIKKYKRDYYQGWRNFNLILPIISANMPTVTGVDMAVKMYNMGGIGALPRFQSVDSAVVDYCEVRSKANAIVSIGLRDLLNPFEENRVAALVHAKAFVFLLDIAHGDHEQVIEAVKYFKKTHKDKFLIVGNVATREAAKRLIKAGADSLKVGIGPGAACITREVTGFGVPQITAIQEVVKAAKGRPVIADGGCRNSGDIVKALAAGADTVMLGSLLAGADEAPNPGVYAGNASKEMNGHHAPEGVSAEVPKTGPVVDTLKKLEWGIRSGISYAGGTNIADLRKVEMIQVSPLSLNESRARI